jgi:sulfate/thiosulfate transport system substrate-binding protein
MWKRVFLWLVAAYIVAAGVWVLASGAGRKEQLLNVACDPTRELWHDVNAAFAAHYEREHGVKLFIRQSHGGSGSQARAVIDGLPADVITLALWTDTNAVRKAGLLDADWEERYPNRSLPYVSTIVFVVRKGNPKNIRDWSDLARQDVEIITPNPKTSGNGKWSFLAMWGSVVWRGGTEDEARDFVTRAYKRAPVLDAAARVGPPVRRDPVQCPRDGRVRRGLRGLRAHRRADGHDAAARAKTVGRVE